MLGDRNDSETFAETQKLGNIDAGAHTASAIDTKAGRKLGDIEAGANTAGAIDTKAGQTPGDADLRADTEKLGWQARLLYLFMFLFWFVSVRDFAGRFRLRLFSFFCLFRLCFLVCFFDGFSGLLSVFL